MILQGTLKMTLLRNRMSRATMFAAGCLLILVAACRVPTICAENCIGEDVALEAGELYTWIPPSEYAFGDEDGMGITVDAINAEISEIVRNQDTEWRPVYRYKPEAGFKGVDAVTLEIRRGSDGASPPTDITTVNLSFVVD